jgi:hypothetical protein
MESMYIHSNFIIPTITFGMLPRTKKSYTNDVYDFLTE